MPQKNLQLNIEVVLDSTSAQQGLRTLAGEIGSLKVPVSFEQSSSQVIGQEIGQEIAEAVTGSLKDLKLPGQQGFFSGLVNTITAPIQSIFTGAFEGIGRDVSRDLGKGVSDGIRRELAPIVGSFELLGREGAAAVIKGLRKAFPQAANFTKEVVSEVVGQSNFSAESGSVQAKAAREQDRRNRQASTFYRQETAKLNSSQLKKEAQSLQERTKLINQLQIQLEAKIDQEVLGSKKGKRLDEQIKERQAQLQELLQQVEKSRDDDEARSALVSRVSGLSDNIQSLKQDFEDLRYSVSREFKDEFDRIDAQIQELRKAEAEILRQAQAFDAASALQVNLEPREIIQAFTSLQADLAKSESAIADSLNADLIDQYELSDLKERLKQNYYQRDEAKTSHAQARIADLEAAIKQRSNQKAEAALSPAAAAELIADQEELERLRSDLQKGFYGPGDQGEADSIRAKIKELQARVRERSEGRTAQQDLIRNTKAELESLRTVLRSTDFAQEVLPFFDNSIKSLKERAVQVNKQVKEAIAALDDSLAKSLIVTRNQLVNQARQLESLQLVAQAYAKFPHDEDFVKTQQAQQVTQAAGEVARSTQPAPPRQSTYERIVKAFSELTGRHIAPTDIPALEATTEPGASGSYVPTRNVLKLPTESLQALDVGDISEKLLKTIVHELRHAVQQDFGRALSLDPSVQLIEPTSEELEIFGKSIQKSVEWGSNQYLSKEQVKAIEGDAYAFAERNVQRVMDILVKQVLSAIHDANPNPNVKPSEAEQLKENVRIKDKEADRPVRTATEQQQKRAADSPPEQGGSLVLAESREIATFQSALSQTGKVLNSTIVPAGKLFLTGTKLFVDALSYTVQHPLGVAKRAVTDTAVSGLTFAAATQIPQLQPVAHVVGGLISHGLDPIVGPVIQSYGSEIAASILGNPFLRGVIDFIGHAPLIGGYFSGGIAEGAASLAGGATQALVGTGTAVAGGSVLLGGAQLPLRAVSKGLEATASKLDQLTGRAPAPALPPADPTPAKTRLAFSLPFGQKRDSEATTRPEGSASTTTFALPPAEYTPQKLSPELTNSFSRPARELEPVSVAESVGEKAEQLKRRALDAADKAGEILGGAAEKVKEVAEGAGIDVSGLAQQGQKLRQASEKVVTSAARSVKDGVEFAATGTRTIDVSVVQDPWKDSPPAIEKGSERIIEVAAQEVKDQTGEAQSKALAKARSELSQIQASFRKLQQSFAKAIADGDRQMVEVYGQGIQEYQAGIKEQIGRLKAELAEVGLDVRPGTPLQREFDLQGKGQITREAKKAAKQLEQFRRTQSEPELYSFAVDQPPGAAAVDAAGQALQQVQAAAGRLTGSLPELKERLELLALVVRTTAVDIYRSEKTWETLDNLLVNLSGTLASIAGGHAGLIPGLAGDLNGALVARGAVSIGREAQVAYQELLQQEAFQTASALEKLQLVVGATAIRLQSPEFQQKIGRQLTEDLIGFVVGNGAASAINAAAPVLSQVPLKGAAVATYVVPKLADVREAHVSASDPEFFSFDPFSELEKENADRQAKTTKALERLEAEVAITQARAPVVSKALTEAGVSEEEQRRDYQRTQPPKRRPPDELPGVGQDVAKPRILSPLAPRRSKAEVERDLQRLDSPLQKLLNKVGLFFGDLQSKASPVIDRAKRSLTELVITAEQKLGVKPKLQGNQARKLEELEQSIEVEAARPKSERILGPSKSPLTADQFELVSRVEERIDKVERTIERQQEKLATPSKPRTRLEQAVDDVQDRAARVINAAGQVFKDQAPKYTAAAKKGFDGLRQSLVGVGGGLNRARAALGPVNRGLQFLIAHAKEAVIGFIAFQVLGQAVDAVIRFGVESFKTASQIDALQKSLAFAAGSERVAAQQIAFVRAESDRLNVPLRSSIEGFQQLANAAKGTAYEGAAIQKVYSALSQAARVTALDNEKLQRVYTGTAQVFSKGTVAAEELRGQILETGIGSFKQFADAIGISTEELNKRLDLGLVSVADFIKFTEKLAVDTASGVEAASTTPQAALDRLGNQFTKFQEQAGKALTPAAVVGIQLLGTALQAAGGFLESVASGFAVLYKALENTGLVSAVSAVFNALGAVFDFVLIKTGLLTAAFVVLSGALVTLASPAVIGAVVVAFKTALLAIQGQLILFSKGLLGAGIATGTFLIGIVAVAAAIAAFSAVLPSAIRNTENLGAGISEVRRAALEAGETFDAKFNEAIAKLQQGTPLTTEELTYLRDGFVANAEAGLDSAHAAGVLLRRLRELQTQAEHSAKSWGTFNATVVKSSEEFKKATTALDLTLEATKTRTAEAAGSADERRRADLQAEVQHSQDLGVALAKRKSELETALTALNASGAKLTEDQRKQKLEAEGQLNEITKQELGNRRKIIEDQIAAANQTIEQAETERQIATQSLLNQGVITEEEANLQRLQSTRARIFEQIQLEGDSAQRQLELAQNEKEQIEARKAGVLKAVEAEVTQSQILLQKGVNDKRITKEDEAEYLLQIEERRLRQQIGLEAQNNSERQKLQLELLKNQQQQQEAAKANYLRQLEDSQTAEQILIQQGLDRRAITQEQASEQLLQLERDRLAVELALNEDDARERTRLELEILKKEEQQREAIKATRLKQIEDGYLAEQTAIQDALNQRVITQEQASQELLNLERERIKAELEANQNDLRERARLTLELLKNEEQQQEKLKELAINRIETTLQAEENAAQRRQAVLNAVQSSLEQQNRLLEARRSLLGSIENLTNAAFEAAKRLARDPEQRKQLEEDIARSRLSGLQKAQEIEEQIFELKRRQEESQRRIALEQTRADILRVAAEREKVNADPRATDLQRQAADAAVVAALAQREALQEAQVQAQQIANYTRQEQQNARRAALIPARLDLAERTQNSQERDALIRSTRNEVTSILGIDVGGGGFPYYSLPGTNRARAIATALPPEPASPVRSESAVDAQLRRIQEQFSGNNRGLTDGFFNRLLDSSQLPESQPLRQAPQSGINTNPGNLILLSPSSLQSLVQNAPRVNLSGGQQPQAPQRPAAQIDPAAVVRDFIQRVNLEQRPIMIELTQNFSPNERGQTADRTRSEVLGVLEEVTRGW